jgi:transcriptional regulator with XRE-family HTH domain
MKHGNSAFLLYFHPATRGANVTIALRTLRQSLEISQSDLARELGVTRQSVRSVESSLRPEPKTLDRYTTALGVIAKRQAADRRREAVARMLNTVDDVLLDVSSTIT